MSFLEKVDVLKKQTFTSEKIAETLECSLSTVKRALREIHDGALIPPFHKFCMTGNARFLCEELDRLGKLEIARHPEFAESKLYLRNRNAMKEAEGLPPFDDSFGFHSDPQNDVERHWFKKYQREKEAYLRRQG
jgi:hypothetical protein